MAWFLKVLVINAQPRQSQKHFANNQLYTQQKNAYV
jgi:hypothetical protein